MSLHLRCVLFAVLCSCDTHVVGQQLLETVEVVGTTPLGLGLDVDRIASNTQIATSEDLRERTIWRYGELGFDTSISYRYHSLNTWFESFVRPECARRSHLDSN